MDLEVQHLLEWENWVEEGCPRLVREVEPEMKVYLEVDQVKRRGSIPIRGRNLLEKRREILGVKQVLTEQVIVGRTKDRTEGLEELPCRSFLILRGLVLQAKMNEQVGFLPVARGQQQILKPSSRPLNALADQAETNPVRRD